AGISMGGWIVCRLAGAHPEMVERLVVVAAAGVRPERETIPVDVLFPHDEDGVRRLVATGRANAPLSPSLVGPANSPPPPQRRRLEDEWIVRRAVSSMAAGRDWLDGTLRRADMPVLVVWGKQDALIPVAMAPRLAAEFPNARLQVLDGCGHVPMADCPDAFDREMLPFLAAGDTSAPGSPAT